MMFKGGSALRDHRPSVQATPPLLESYEEALTRIEGEIQTAKRALRTSTELQHLSLPNIAVWQTSKIFGGTLQIEEAVSEDARVDISEVSPVIYVTFPRKEKVTSIPSKLPQVQQRSKHAFNLLSARELCACEVRISL